MIFLLLIFILFLIPALYYLLDYLIHSFKVSDYEEKFVLISSCDSQLATRLALKLDTLGFHVIAGFNLYHSHGEKDFLVKEASAHLLPIELVPSSTQSIHDVLNSLDNSPVGQRGLWALINTADTLGSAMPCEGYTVEDYKAVLDSNLYGPVEISRRFLPLLRQAGGRIINISCTPPLSSSVSFSHSPYVVSKAGIEGYSDMLRRELYRQGIKVSIIQTNTSHLDANVNVKDTADKQLTRLNRQGNEMENVYSNEFIQAFINGCQMRTKENNSLTDYEDEILASFISALTDRFPQARYVVGSRKTRLLSKLYHYMPDFFIDKFLMWNLSNG